MYLLRTHKGSSSTYPYYVIIMPNSKGNRGNIAYMPWHNPQLTYGYEYSRWIAEYVGVNKTYSPMVNP